MTKTSLYIDIAGALLALTATPSFAANTYQNTCSNITFVYCGNDAAMQAVCLRTDGTPNQTKLILHGISNQYGKLVQGTGASTFQKSCGNIQFVIAGPYTTLSAISRNTAGNSDSTSLGLNNISNINRNLSQ